jgi:negative elongation factor A
MAAVSREAETTVWLHNKLGSTDDLWSGSTICSQLTRDKLLNILECFQTLQAHVKVKLMLSFLHLPKRNIEEWKEELDYLHRMALEDSDQWVSMIGDVLRIYPNTGNLNTEVRDSHLIFHEVLADLKKLVKKHQDIGMLPLECCYLSRQAMSSIAGQQPQLVKYFALKRKPKSAALRADILQKSNEAANNLKKNSGTIPVKMRSFAKKMDDTTPLRGLPNPTTPGSGFMRSTNSVMGRYTGTPAGGQKRENQAQKEGGIKFLDITEQPIGIKEAKRRKKQSDMDAAQQTKKNGSPSVAGMPDYAAGLTSNFEELPGGQTPAVSTENPAFPATPTGSTPILPAPVASTVSTPNNIILLSGASNAMQGATIQARDNLQQKLEIRMVPPSSVANSIVGQPQIVPVQPSPVTSLLLSPTAGIPLVSGTTAMTIRLVPQPNPAPSQDQQPKKGLSLTREQMLEAQEMFKTYPNISRPEKALILGFMAGARENPLPQQGQLMNIRLGESHESVQQPDGTFRPMVIESFLQLNYMNGEWKRFNKMRQPEPDAD